MMPKIKMIAESILWEQPHKKKNRFKEISKMHASKSCSHKMKNLKGSEGAEISGKSSGENAESFK